MTENWQDYFKPPFHNDSIVPEIVWDSMGHRVITTGMDYNDVPDEVMEILANAMNGTPIPEHPYTFGNPKYVGTPVDSYVEFTHDGQTYRLNIRGWGYLTGELKLDYVKAGRIQDAFGAFVVECMKQEPNGGIDGSV